MKKVFIQIIGVVMLSVLTIAVCTLSFARYIPMSALGLHFDGDKLGAVQSLTAITGTTLISDLDTILTTNFNLLNNNKIEMSTTTLPKVTTMAGLVTTGVLASSTYRGTMIQAVYGGTSSTTLALNRLMLGNTTNGFKTLVNSGTSGQFLTSAGSGNPPTWTTGSVDTTLNRVWTGWNSFTYGTTTNATSTHQYIVSRLFIGTTTPSVEKFSLSGDMYIDDGGLGVGRATTTDDALDVAGNAVISGNLSIGLISTSSAAVAGPTVDDNTVDRKAHCPSGTRVVGGGFTTTGEVSGASGVGVYKNYPDSATSWISGLICHIGGGCAASTIQSYALCARLK